MFGFILVVVGIFLFFKFKNRDENYNEYEEDEVHTSYYRSNYRSDEIKIHPVMDVECRGYKTEKINSDNCMKVTKQGKVIFLNWVDGKSILDAEDYPKYFYYDYNIRDCNKFHRDMIDEKYLEFSSPEQIIRHLKVDELKEILSKFGIKKSGKKKELIERILNEIDISKLKLETTTYQLSKKGKELIKKYEYLIKLRRTDITPEEYEKLAKHHPEFSFNDILWGIYNQRSLEYYSKKDFGLYRNNLLDMSYIVEEEGKYTQELIFLLQVIYCDLSGLGNNGFILPKDSVFLAPGITDEIRALKEYYSKDVMDAALKLRLPFTHCDDKTFIKIIDEMLAGVDDDTILENFIK